MRNRAEGTVADAEVKGTITILQQQQLLDAAR